MLLLVEAVPGQQAAEADLELAPADPAVALNKVEAELDLLRERVSKVQFSIKIGNDLSK